MMKKNDIDLEVTGQRRKQIPLSADPLTPSSCPEDGSDPLHPSLLLAAYLNATRRKHWPYWVPVAIAGVLLILVLTIWYARGAHSPSAIWSSTTTATSPRPASCAPPSLAAKGP